MNYKVGVWCRVDGDESQAAAHGSSEVTNKVARSTLRRC